MGISQMAEWKTITVPLLHPIKVGELFINEFVLSEPDVEALELLDEAGFQDGVQPTTKQVRIAIEALCRQPYDVVKRLHKDDFASIGGQVAPLLNGPTDTGDGSASTGETSGTSPAT